MQVEIRQNVPVKWFPYLMDVVCNLFTLAKRSGENIAEHTFLKQKNVYLTSTRLFFWMNTQRKSPHELSSQMCRSRFKLRIVGNLKRWSRSDFPFGKLGLYLRRYVLRCLLLLWLSKFTMCLTTAAQLKQSMAIARWLWWSPEPVFHRMGTSDRYVVVSRMLLL